MNTEPQSKSEEKQKESGLAQNQFNLEADDKKIIDKGDNNPKKHTYQWQRIEDQTDANMLKKIKLNNLAKYDHLKDELLNNNLATITGEEWNATLQKSVVILKSWTGKSIRSTEDMNNDDKAWHWQKNETITVCELLGFKMYTDFTKLQFEMTKTSWLFDGKDELDERFKRLKEFYHWKTMLDGNIRKFGYYLRERPNEVLYHGVNPFIELSNCRDRICISPLSTTRKKEVARSFATKNGFILELKTLYPKKAIDYAFDVSTISDYPEEHEVLVGLMHPRIINIETGLASRQEFGAALSENPTTLIFFVAHLFMNQKFCMDEKLEELLLSVLYCNENRKVSGSSIDKEYLQEMHDEIIKNSNKETKLKFDTISKNLKTIFMEKRNADEDNDMNWKLSFDNIFRMYPNLKELDLFNHYVYDKDFYDAFVSRKKEEIQLSSVCFSYFDDTYEQHNEQPMPDLDVIDWRIEHLREPKKNTGKGPWLTIELTSNETSM